MRHTKIVATLGPASSDPVILERMVHAGVDVVRMNFSHGKPEDHVARAESTRDASARVGRPVGILADLAIETGLPVAMHVAAGDLVAAAGPVARPTSF